MFIQLLQWLLQHPLGPVPLPVLEGVAWAGGAYRWGGVQLSGCVLTESLAPGLSLYTRRAGRDP